MPAINTLRVTRPRDPVRRHFEVAEKGDLKVNRVQCRYCQKSFSAVNPSRLQGHIVKCVAYRERSNSLTSEPEPERLSTTAAAAGDTDASETSPLQTHVRALDTQSPATQPRPISASRATPLHSPRYEKLVLEANAIFVQLHGYVLPPDLLEINKSILYHNRPSSPPLDPASAQQMAFSVANASTASSVIDFLFPHHVASNYARSERAYFYEEACPNGVPWGAVSNVQKVSTPTPYLTFGYREVADAPLMRAQRATFEGCDLTRICNPIPYLYRPYFIIELRSSGSSMMSARNSAAGAGAACVFSARTMSMLAPGTQYTREIAMAYSCTIVGFLAILWVHWMEPTKAINMAPVETYNLSKGDDFMKLKKHAASVVEWGLTKRWDMQKAHLYSIDAAMAKDDENMSLSP